MTITQEKPDEETRTTPDVVSLAQELVAALADKRAADQELTEAQERVQARRRRLTEICHDYANRRSWCSDFDDYFSETGLPRRNRTLVWTARVRVAVPTDVVHDYTVQGMRMRFRHTVSDVAVPEGVTATIQTSGQVNNLWDDCVCDQVTTEMVTGTVRSDLVVVADDHHFDITCDGDRCVGRRR
jgi:hypothetical protein